ncbi:unnamed protein product [Rangifer tarandus platyrhynchus]|uniref:Uncharacterized protein n=2 Tax=Rangifer tarandus platyrhynchus TaxID=3082113 RepID=A0ABN8YHJ0_RANTA|nr:unnamed protein product [Rangifer tarandus platyrhynchus]CAI9699560.1 unnamed protein product [Rangifer tarandus platyrhynchus]
MSGRKQVNLSRLQKMPTVTGALGASPAAGRVASGTSGSRILLGASSPLLAPMGSYLSMSEPVAPAGPAQSAGLWRQAWSSPQMPRDRSPSSEGDPQTVEALSRQAAPGGRPGASCSWPPG